MAFSNKRGRPKQIYTQEDKGTKELRAKHLQGLTLAPLDLALRKHIIDQKLYKSAIKFMYLYSARFPSTPLRAYRISDERGRIIDNRNERLLKKCCKEFDAIQKKLQKQGSYYLIRDICVYQQTPLFLLSGTRYSELAYYQYTLFIEGLRLLAAIWSP